MPTHISESRTEYDIARELLAVRGWDSARPPRGDVLRKQEYKQYPQLASALALRSKSGDGPGYPDFMVVDRQSLQPLIVIEAKADDKELRTAIDEAEFYAGAFINGTAPLAVGVAGTQDTEIAVGVQKWSGTKWKAIEYKRKPIQWIPAPDEARNLILDHGRFSLDPEVPPADILARYAEEINRILRECQIKDEFRPAAMAAFMLGLWRSQGRINTHPELILADINRACEKAFETAGKYEIAKTIHLPEENEALAARASQICYILRLLNITTLTSAHDYLGQLYETFFRFTGGNTIGQYFTPRHISRFMADLVEVSKQDRVLDPTCGTGGFLIASLYRMIEGTTPTQKQLSDLVKEHLLGYETEPITAALCVANMILRGDGATGIIKGDSLSARDFPKKKMTVVLGNPPFPHKSTDHPPEQFVDRGLEALETRGTLAMLVPSATLSKRDRRDWRTKVLKHNTLKAVIKVPDELFQPFASSYADIVVLEKGIPHNAENEVFFCYIQDDGYKIKKGVRIRRGDGDLPRALKAYRDHKSIAGLCVFAHLKGDAWGPGTYVEAVAPSFDEIMEEVTALIRAQISFQVKFADKLATFREALADGRLEAKPYAELTTRDPNNYLSKKRHSLGRLFDIYYGQKSLHSKEHLPGGESLIISSKGTDNGCFGFFGFPDLIQPPFISAPGTGSIGETSVQLLPCGVSDDCVLLFPKPGTAPEELWTAAATIRRERWRFHYGFKLTPDRIKHYVVPRSPELLMAIRDYLQRAMPSMRKLSVALASFSGSSAKALDDSQLFAELRDKWQEETKLISNVTKRALNPNYQQIIGMGEAAVPLILNDIVERGTDDWFWALTAITGENPITEDIAGNMTAMAQSWIKWGRTTAYLNDSQMPTSNSSKDSSQTATE